MPTGGLPRTFVHRPQGSLDDCFFQQEKGAAEAEPRDITSLVNALRNRRMYQRSSLRLLSDLVEVMLSSEPRPKNSRRARRAFARPAAPDALDSDWLLVQRAAAASPCLFRSLDLADRPKLREVAAPSTVHRLLLCERDGLGAPIAALAHALAAAIARQFDEPAAAAVLDGGQARARLWFRGREIALAAPAASYAALQDALARALQARAPRPAARPPLLHIILAAPAGTRRLPPRFRTPPGFRVGGRRRAARSRYRPADTAGYDRILYLTDAVPDRAPARLVSLLTPAARRPAHGQRNEGPYFSAFVATVVASKPARKSNFDSEPVDQEMDRDRRQPPRPPGWRLRRDACRAPFGDLPSLRPHWQRGAAGGAAQARATAHLLADPDARAVADRWARAVTNRQVGLALSGGGALSYRLVPIIRGIHAQRIPIDVVAGVSGGALIAAYYCHGGVAGLEACMALGERIGPRALAKAFLFADAFQELVDSDLGHAELTSLTTRLVALATAILETGPPASHVVTRGTLGAAVQVSGAAPVLFHPTVKQTSRGEARFVDGATSAFVPVRILRDCGADLVFALNCLAGPSNRNPLAGTAAQWIYRVPFADRLLDLWVAGSYLAQRIGRETDEDAHVYFEPDEEQRPLIGSFDFTECRAIADESARTARVKRCIEDCAARWKSYSRWP